MKGFFAFIYEAVKTSIEQTNQAAVSAGDLR